MVRVKEIIKWVDEYAPFRFAQQWDQCGLQVGDPEAEVSRILVALDPSSRTLDEAKTLGCTCLITHHPLIFKPLKAVRTDQFPGLLVVSALRMGINLIAAHTNLDSAREGTNDQLAGLLSLIDLEPLEIDRAWAGESRYAGMGTMGNLPGSVSLEGFALEAARVLGGIEVRVVGDPQREVRRVALCTGSGGSFIEDVIAAGVDVYVTGDVKYHEAQRAMEAGVAIIDVGHFASERVVLEPLARFLTECAARESKGVEVLVARQEDDPFRIFKA